jgi:hypothetical protein
MTMQSGETDRPLPIIMVSELSRLELAVTHILYKSAKRRSLAMLVDHEELPDDAWASVRDVAWRMGAVGIQTEQGHRAWISGAVTAFRLLKDSAKVRRLGIQVLPFASESDAVAAAPHMPMRLLFHDDAAGEWMIKDGLKIPGVLRPLAFERFTERMGVRENQRMVVGSIDRIAFHVCSHAVDAFDWDEVTQIAELQAEKIRRSTKSEGSGG